jgi:hypothetical protein
VKECDFIAPGIFNFFICHELKTFCDFWRSERKTDQNRGEKTDSKMKENLKKEKGRKKGM